jgi:hypothetical protein
VADILVPAALVAHAATSDPAYRTVAELYMPWSSC